MPAPFDLSQLPSIQEPWGPMSTIPESLRFNDVPYAPFSKSDKLGKAADWQQAKEEEQLKQQQQKNQNQKNKRDQYHAYGASAAKSFGAETEEQEFSIVDNSATPVNKQQTTQTTVLRGRKQRGAPSGGASGARQPARSGRSKC
ncbi:unnamed protein product [Ambrosiozyma monospora]|uniref:Unnamed protein product n=1 Tax=Ambrosiozyma monospora TaxID=43982 RepID=A0ACB5UDF7_AMBMO|nr:unnamed protein product [Ambrosiozyma monospora]